MKDIRLHDEIAAKLVAMAGRDESLEMAANHALRAYFSHKEEERRWQETLAADAAMDRGDAVDGEKVIAWLESWGKDGELPPP